MIKVILDGGRMKKTITLFLVCFVFICFDVTLGQALLPAPSVTSLAKFIPESAGVSLCKFLLPICPRPNIPVEKDAFIVPFRDWIWEQEYWNDWYSKTGKENENNPFQIRWAGMEYEREKEERARNEGHNFYNKVKDHPRLKAILSLLKDLAKSALDPRNQDFTGITDSLPYLLLEKLKKEEPQLLDSIDANKYDTVYYNLVFLPADHNILQMWQSGFHYIILFLAECGITTIYYDVTSLLSNENIIRYNEQSNEISYLPIIYIFTDTELDRKVKAIIIRSFRENLDNVESIRDFWRNYDVRSKMRFNGRKF